MVLQVCQIKNRGVFVIGELKRMSWKLSPDNFGMFYPYIIDGNVTDIDYNGELLWITNLEKGRYCVMKHGITLEFVEQFTHIIANIVNRPFNRANNLLEAETGNLRISIIHESAAVSGRSICIRKASPRVRNTIKTLIDNEFCTTQILFLLINCVKARMNFIFAGEPGAGKTECARFFSQFIDKSERVITIEDNPEFHYRDINPGKDCVELRVDEKDFTYSKAIKTCLRQNPRWIFLSEARSTEVKYLLESWSTGIYGFTTIHTDDVRKIPDRIQNMMSYITDAKRLENDIYEFVNVGILIRKKSIDKKIHRYVDQICFFGRKDGNNFVSMIVEDGAVVSKDIPSDIQKKLNYAGITQPYDYAAICKGVES